MEHQALRTFLSISMEPAVFTIIFVGMTTVGVFLFLSNPKWSIFSEDIGVLLGKPAFQREIERLCIAALKIIVVAFIIAGAVIILTEIWAPVVPELKSLAVAVASASFLFLCYLRFKREICF